MKQRFPVRAFALFLALFALSAGPAGAQLATVSSPSGPVVAGPYLVVDAATGETLLQRDAGAAWYPASLTKLMTLYLVFEDLKAGRLTLATPVPFSQHAASASPSKLGIGVGGSITVEQAIQSLVARSANDAAVALGEKVSGSEAAFAQRMTQTAKRLGMTATEFRNANGWPDPGQVTTARDLAILTLALMRDVGEYYPYFQTREFMLGKQRIGPGVKFVEMYAPYADGLKTGFICSSGFNIVGSAVRDGRRLIAIAFGFRRADLRDEFLVRLFDQAFALKTAGSRPKIWQVPNEAGHPTTVLSQGECGLIRYDMPGDAAWLGTYGDWRTARNAYDVGQAELGSFGARLGKEYILPVTVNKATRQAAIIADLEPGAAQKLCAQYRAKKLFCEVKKPQDFVAPFSGFWR
ncbi:D-alanyl-D-alanine carboxypeptidase family protein [Reyranella sp.]|uniref:D-alanyl-D-alanine carboxypeptidase family protein n=1 Tax=Reyranella sp. TaxID=1929291 RepID=UPI003D0B51DE